MSPTFTKPQLVHGEPGPGAEVDVHETIARAPFGDVTLDYKRWRYGDGSGIGHRWSVSWFGRDMYLRAFGDERSMRDLFTFMVASR